MNGSGDVELVQERVAVFAYGCSENDDFVDFTDALEESIDTRAFNDIDVVVLTFDFNGNGEVGLVQNLERQISQEVRELCRILDLL